MSLGGYLVTQGGIRHPLQAYQRPRFFLSCFFRPASYVCTSDRHAWSRTTDLKAYRTLRTRPRSRQFTLLSTSVPTPIKTIDPPVPKPATAPLETLRTEVDDSEARDCNVSESDAIYRGPKVDIKDVATRFVKYQARQAQRRRNERLRRAQIHHIDHKSTPPNWKDILDVLVKHTPVDRTWFMNGLLVSVPRDEYSELLHGPSDIVEDIASRNGCSTTSLDAGITGKMASFSISGPAISLRRVIQEIHRSSPQASIRTCADVSVSNLAADREQPVPAHGLINQVQDRGVTVRNVFSQARGSRLSSRGHVPKPRILTPDTLAEYISALCSAKTILYRNSAAKDTTSVPLEHHRIGALREILLEDDQAQPHISRLSFRAALQFMVKHSHSSLARAALLQRSSKGFPLDQECFNVLLHAAAIEVDGTYFMSLLSLMDKMGLYPNAGTWDAFLSAIQERELASKVVAIMAEKGLLTSITALQSVIGRIVAFELEETTQLDYSMQEFMTHMHERYGPQWLGRKSTEKILNFLASHQRLHDCNAFLGIMEAHFVRPNVRSVNIVLKLFKNRDDIAGAVKFLHELPATINFTPDEATFHTLFEFSWRGSYLNVSRTIWKYACAANCAAFRMRRIIRESLANNPIKVKSYLVRPNSALFVTAPDAACSADTTRLYNELVRVVNKRMAPKADDDSQSLRNMSKVPEVVIQWLNHEHCSTPTSPKSFQDSLHSALQLDLENAKAQPKVQTGFQRRQADKNSIDTLEPKGIK